MKKVLLIASELGKGGAERSISMLSYHLEAHCEVTLCILSGTDRKKYYKTCKNVLYIDPPVPTNLRSKIKAWAYRLKAIKDLKKMLDADVAISFLEGPNYVNVLTKGREKVIIGVRGSKQFDGAIRGWNGWLRKKVLIPFLYSGADKVVCASNALMNEMHRHFGVPSGKLSYIYNLYDNEEILQKAAAPLSEGEQRIFSKPVLINSGRLHPQKRQAELIRLFGHFRKQHDARLVILGDGELKCALLEEARVAGLMVCDMGDASAYREADVYFLGYQSNAFKFYRHSKVFVLASAWEGFPNAMAEALICYLPVVATDCPTGPREILNIEGLAPKPVTTVHRNAAGSLMPLLDSGSREQYALWEAELAHWLSHPAPAGDVFKTFTDRFPAPAVLQQWMDLVDGEKKVSKHVLLLITNLGAGGAQRAFSEQSLYLKERFGVTEAVFDKREFADIYKTGNRQLSLHVTGGKTIVGKVVKLYQRARRLKKIVDGQRIPLCISHMDGANWVNILSGSAARKILVVHGTVLHDYGISPAMLYVRNRWMIPLLYKRADCVVAVSEGIKRELETVCGLKNVVAIPNAFNIRAVQQKAALPLPHAWAALFAENEVLITSGRLHVQKKQRYLLPLFKKIKAQREGAKLVVLGDGSLREPLLEEAAALGLRCYNVWDGSQALTTGYDVYFAGHVDNPFSFLRRSRLFLFPSGWEGFPLALCEAMICGVPVLAADCPTGPREIIAPGTFDIEYRLSTLEATEYGYLLPVPGKPEFEPCWHEAVMSLLNDTARQKQLIAKGKERMRAFDQSLISARWLRITEAMLDQTT